MRSRVFSSGSHPGAWPLYIPSVALARSSRIIRVSLSAAADGFTDATSKVGRAVGFCAHAAVQANAPKPIHQNLRILAPLPLQTVATAAPDVKSGASPLDILGGETYHSPRMSS